jgi:4-hydroxy-3-methylbut-2-enyl diphosphate reductase
VKRALAWTERAVREEATRQGRLVLLGEIIHNPWVNDYFRAQGVQILTRSERHDLEDHLGPEDCAIIPAFGVPLPVERRLGEIGCRIVDSSCSDVRRLWTWAQHAVEEGYGVVIYGRAKHDETVVTKSRLAEAGGKYVVLASLSEVNEFCRMVASPDEAESFAERFDEAATNAADLSPFEHLAQVSQTTMLYRDTQEVRRRIEEAFVSRFGVGQAQQRLQFQPTVCQATQQRQEAAVELCQSGCDVVIVVGGFTSSNTHHLFDLASSYAPTYFVENAKAILDVHRLEAFDPSVGRPRVFEGWLKAGDSLRIGVLAGASCPEVVVGEVLERLAGFLQEHPKRK